MKSSYKAVELKLKSDRPTIGIYCIVYSVFWTDSASQTLLDFENKTKHAIYS